MKPFPAALAALLFFGILTQWVQELWAWAVFQVGIFMLAALRLVVSRRVRFHPASLPLAMAAAWPLLQLASAETVARGETWSAVLNWGTYLWVFLLACDTLAEAAARNWFLKAISLGAALLAILSIAQKYSAAGKIFWLFPSGYADDVLGPFVNRNHYAVWVELLLPVALYLAAMDRRSRVLYGTGAAIMLGSVIAGGSRMGSVLVLAEAIGVMALFAARNDLPQRARVIRSIQFAGLAAIAVAVSGSQILRTRLEALGPEPLRVDALHASLKMIGDRPWAGSGLGTWSIMYPRYAGIDTGAFMNQAHNDWAQWAAEGGLPFLLLLFVFAACLSKPAFRSIYGLGVIALLLHALVDYPMQQRPALAGWFFAIAGAAVARNAHSRGQTHRSLTDTELDERR
jgi:hypothetical protein